MNIHDQGPSQSRPSPKLMMHIAYYHYFTKIINTQLFRIIYKFPNFRSTYVFFGLISVFASIYFDHDAFMHHALHVLDATGLSQERNWWSIWFRGGCISEGFIH